MHLNLRISEMPCSEGAPDSVDLANGVCPLLRAVTLGQVASTLGRMHSVRWIALACLYTCVSAIMPVISCVVMPCIHTVMSQHSVMCRQPASRPRMWTTPNDFSPNDEKDNLTGFSEMEPPSCTLSQRDSCTYAAWQMYAGHARSSL